MKRSKFIKTSMLGLGLIGSGSTIASLSKRQPQIIGFNHLPVDEGIKTMKTILHKAETRGHADHGWLDARHSFSFASYYNPQRIQFGALRVLNDDWVEGGKGFGKHPHDNMEIVTIPLQGAIEHKDSMGNHGVIKQNEVQIMSAGTGVYHSEFNAHANQKLNLFQIWVFPKNRDVKPRYEQRTYLPTDRVNKFQTVVSPVEGEAMAINQDAWFSLGDFEKDKEQVYEIRRKGNGAYIMVAEGNAEIEGQELGKRDAIGVWDTEKILIKAKSDLKILVLDVPMDV